MATLAFNCSGCGQPIECDQQSAGQQLTCPYCQAIVTAPAAKAPGRVGLSVVPTAAHGTHAPAPSVIPPPSNKPKPKSYRKQIVAGVIAIVLVGGLIAAFPMLKPLLDKASTKFNEARGNGNASETDQTNAAQSEVTNTATAAPENPQATSTLTAASSQNLPTVEHAHNLEVETCEIPRSKLSGVISSEAFSPDVIRVDKSGNAYILYFRQGTNAFEREMSIVLRMKPGQSIETNSWIIPKDMKSGAPQVTKKWKTGPRLFAQKAFSTGYAMKLEFGKIENGVLPGKIYVALPDKEATVVAGHFNAETKLTGNTAPAVPQ